MPTLEEYEREVWKTTAKMKEAIFQDPRYIEAQKIECAQMCEAMANYRIGLLVEKPAEFAAIIKQHQEICKIMPDILKRGFNALEDRDENIQEMIKVYNNKSDVKELEEDLVFAAGQLNKKAPIVNDVKEQNPAQVQKLADTVVTEDYIHLLDAEAKRAAEFKAGGSLGSKAKAAFNSLFGSSGSDPDPVSKAKNQHAQNLYEKFNVLSQSLKNPELKIDKKIEAADNLLLVISELQKERSAKGGMSDKIFKDKFADLVKNIDSIQDRVKGLRDFLVKSKQQPQAEAPKAAQSAVVPPQAFKH